MKHTSDSTPETIKKSPGARKVIDPRALEVAAARGLPQPQIASEMGVSSATLSNRLREDASLRAAYERGRARVGKGTKASRKALPAADAAQAPKPAAPAVKLDREEDAEVFAALQDGPRCRMEIKEATGLTYDEINDALYRLRFECGLVGMQEGKLGKEFFFILGDEEKAAARVMAASGAGPEAPSVSPQILEPPVVSDKRLARTVEAVKGEREKPAGTLAASNGNGHAAATPSSVAPPVHVPGLPPPNLPVRERAVRAALVEFSFIEFWGAPSNRFGDTRELLASAFGTFGGEVS